MAIFVVLATIAGVVIVALTTSSGDSFEDAGSTDLGENCRPHEVRDQALESMGISGTHEHLDQYKSDTIGCKPYCGTWEYYSKGQNANGVYEYDPDAALGATIGGPDGAGGVVSSKPGCFAPCYMWFDSSEIIPTYMAPSDLRHTRLHFFDDNRVPERYHFRLGINYVRNPESEGVPGFGVTDLAQSHTIFQNKDGKRFFLLAKRNKNKGVRLFAGRLGPTELSQFNDLNIPTIYIPNFVSQGQDPAETSGDLKDRNVNNSPLDNKDTDNDGNWADENWEWRADPINRTCTIVNVTQNDRIVCSSEWENCASRP